MKTKEKKPTKETKPRKITFALSPWECHCLMEELRNILRICNRDNRNALLFWELFAKGLYEKDIKYADGELRNKILGINPLEGKVNVPKEDAPKKEESLKSEQPKEKVGFFKWFFSLKLPKERFK